MYGVTTTGTILDRIAERKREEVAALKLPPLTVLQPTRDFIGALRCEQVALIAEIKHASPSKGVLIENFDPVGLATTYAANGAAAISVLTDRDFFQGSLEDLKAVWAAVNSPVLRKDFTIDVRQIVEARAAGADAILLIVALLDDALLNDLFTAAAEYGLAALIEVHTEAEMERALRLNPPLIGINNRDLHTFKVDMGVTQDLAKMARSHATLVAESGIFTVGDVEAVAAVGGHAVLVGELIVKSDDIGRQVRALSSVRRS